MLPMRKYHEQGVTSYIYIRIRDNSKLTRKLTTDEHKYTFKADTTPWFLHRAHFGVLGNRSGVLMSP